MIQFFRKAFLSVAFEMTKKKWNWYFCGITINKAHYGFGFVWRKKKDETSEDIR